MRFISDFGALLKIGGFGATIQILRVKYEFFMKADLHMHTTFSDGISTPEEMVETAVKRGIKCICITDHDTLEGAAKAIKFASNKDILVISGIELVSTSGDILGINVKRIIPSGLSAKDTVKEIRKQGGIAVIPHPFNKPLNAFWGGENALAKLFPDAIEAFNASVAFSYFNKKALNFSRKNNLSFTAGSDSHNKKYVGRGYIEVSDNILNEKDLVKAIMEKKAGLGGEKLSAWEIVKNGGHTDVKDIISYMLYKRKNKNLDAKILL